MQLSFLFNKFLCLLAICLFSSNLWAINEHKKDSLMTVIDSLDDRDSLKVRALMKLSSLFNRSDLNLSKKWMKIALDLSLNQENYRLSVTALRAYGVNCFHTGKKDSAKYYYRLSIKYAEENNFPVEGAMSESNIGIIYAMEGNYPQALKKFIASLKVFEKYQNKRTEKLATPLYLNIGLTYQNQFEEDSLAMAYYEKAEERYLFESNNNGLGTVYNNLSNIYLDQGNKAKAYALNKKALFYREKDSGSPSFIQSLFNMSSCLLIMDSVDMARVYLDSAYQMSKRIHYKDMIIKYHVIYHSIYRKLEQFDSSFVHIKKAQKFLKNIEGPQITGEVYAGLAESFEDLGNIDSSLKYFKLLKHIDDSLNQKRNKIKMLAMNVLAKSDLQETQLKAELKQKEERFEFLFIIINGTFVLILIIAWLYLSKRKTYKLLEYQNQKVLDSITYAQRIQGAILLNENLVKEIFPNSFVFYQAKDIVGGDFYWMHREGDKAILVVADCVGHGVPGAFMTMIGNTLLNDIIIERKIQDPGQVLSELHKGVVLSLHQDSVKDALGEAMDASVCCLDFKLKELSYAGAMNHMYLVKDKVLEVVKADFKSVGGVFKRKVQLERSFETKKRKISSGDRIYLYTDGYCDQFGGERNEKFNTAKFKHLIIEKGLLMPMQEQEALFSNAMNSWMDGEGQTDDMLIVGIEV